MALNPLADKNKANMLVFKKDIFSHKKVFDLLKYVSENDLLVFNNTSVLPCRLIGERVRPSSENTKPKISITLNKAVDGNIWTTFCKPLKKLKEGDTSGLVKGLVGWGLFGTAMQIRDSKIAGDKWNELKVGDKTIDIYPYNPLAAYLFVPYIAWLGVALSLNLYIFLYN